MAIADDCADQMLLYFFLSVVSILLPCQYVGTFPYITLHICIDQQKKLGTLPNDENTSAMLQPSLPFLLISRQYFTRAPGEAK